MESADTHRETAIQGRWPNRRRSRRLLALGVFSAGVLAFSWLVWPTPYRYGRDPDRHRVNRLTGEAQVYDKRKDEWRRARRGEGGGSRGNAGNTGSYGSREDSPIGGGSSGGDYEGGGYSGGGSPIGGSRSGTRGSSAPTGDGSPIGGSRSGGGGKARGDQWWYKDKQEAARERRDDPGGSPVGGSREPAEKGSPIGGQ